MWPSESSITLSSFRSLQQQRRLSDRRLVRPKRGRGLNTLQPWESPLGETHPPVDDSLSMQEKQPDGDLSGVEPVGAESQKVDMELR